MSASLRFAANGDITGSLRRPSRNLMSAQCVNHAGCPASDGMATRTALPSTPWQRPHGSALRRPASRSGVCADNPADAPRTTATTTMTNKRGGEAPPLSMTVAGARPSALVGDVVDGPVVVIGEQ